MGTRINKIAKGVSKMIGAGDLVDYTSSKIAKYHTLRGKPEAKLVEDKTSGKKALISAVVAGSTLVGGAGLARGLAKRAVGKASSYGSFKIPGQARPVKYNKQVGANPSSLKHLKGDKKIK